MIVKESVIFTFTTVQPGIRNGVSLEACLVMSSLSSRRLFGSSEDVRSLKLSIVVPFRTLLQRPRDQGCVEPVSRWSGVIGNLIIVKRVCTRISDVC